jgi:transposase-like protein
VHLDAPAPVDLRELSCWMYSDEIKDRAVWLVFQVSREPGGRTAAVHAVADQLGIDRETLRCWVRQTHMAFGVRARTPMPGERRIAQAGAEQPRTARHQ